MMRPVLFFLLEEGKTEMQSIFYFICGNTDFYFMAKTKAQKQKTLEDLKEKIGRMKSVVFVDFTGLKVKDLSRLRRDMKKNGAEFKVAKKTLIQLAFASKDANVKKESLQGEIALGFGYEDEMAPFKQLYQFSKGNENLKILGGLFEGQFIDAVKALELAKLPGREELLARMFSVANSPLQGLANILQGSLSILKVKG